jgi:hypothetical protein
MMKKTILALSAALMLGSGSAALAQVYVAPYEPGPVVVTPYALPYAVVSPYAAPYFYRPYLGEWRDRHARRRMGDTNGF